jgi:hypothetical protein
VSEHRFTVTIFAALADAQLDALDQAGCDDATFSTDGNLSYGDFDREAPTLLEAVVSAVVNIESVDDLEVLRVEPDIDWASQLPDRMARSRRSADFLIHVLTRAALRAWRRPNQGEGWALLVLGFGVGDEPSRLDVVSRYRDLVRAAHPDAGGDPEAAGIRIAELTEARRILSAPA